MCYSNCPYERYGGDNWGACAKPKMQNTELAHCWNGETEEEEREDDDE